MSRLRSGSATDRGRIRPSNQDRLIVSDNLVAVADGMGGHVGGEVAARTAVEKLLESFGTQRTSEGLVTAVQVANRAIWDRSRAQGDLRGMGTTLTAAALVSDGEEEHLTLVNVGDSRAYLFDHGHLVQLTQDHSLVEEMVRHGELTVAEAATHPHRHILTRALGIDRGVEIDAWRLEPPEGSRVLLCSDGLTNELSEDEIAGVLGSVADPGPAAEKLVNLAVAHGGTDNVTAVVVDVLSDADAAGAPQQPQSGGVHAAPGPRKPGPAGSTEGLTGFVPAVPLSVARDAAAAAAAGAAAGAAGGAAGAGAAAAGAAGGVPGPRRPGPRLPGARPTGRRRASEAGGDATGGFPAETSAAALGATAAVPSVGGSRSDTTAVPVTRPPGRADGAAGDLGSRRNGDDPVRRGAGADTPGRSSRPMMLVAPSRGERRGRGERVLTLRVVLFALILVGILGGTAAAVGWFVESSYFVGLAGREVVIYHGRPGGLLWFQPSVVERTGLLTSQLIPPDIPALRAGLEEPSFAAAQELVHKLGSDRTLLPLFSSTTTVPASTVPTGAPLGGTNTTSPPPLTTVVIPSSTSTVPTTTVPATTSTFASTTTTTGPTTTTSPTTTTTTPTGTTKPPHGTATSDGAGHGGARR